MGLSRSPLGGYGGEAPRSGFDSPDTPRCRGCRRTRVQWLFFSRHRQGQRRAKRVSFLAVGLCLMLRVQIVYTGLAGMPAVNNVYFEGSGPVLALGAAGLVSDFVNELTPFLSDDVTVDVSNIVVEINPASGETIEFHEGTGLTVQGEAVVDPLPVGTSAVFQFRTGGVVAGRRVQGRIYVPGMDEGVNGPGGLMTASIPPILGPAASTTLGAGNPVHVVWSRPVEGGRAGSTHPVNVYAVSRVFSNLRSRRR